MQGFVLNNKTCRTTALTALQHLNPTTIHNLNPTISLPQPTGTLFRSLNQFWPSDELFVWRLLCYDGMHADLSSRQLINGWEEGAKLFSSDWQEGSLRTE